MRHKSWRIWHLSSLTAASVSIIDMVHCGMQAADSTSSSMQCVQSVARVRRSVMQAAVLIATNVVARWYKYLHISVLGSWLADIGLTYRLLCELRAMRPVARSTVAPCRTAYSAAARQAAGSPASRARHSTTRYPPCAGARGPDVPMLCAASTPEKWPLSGRKSRKRVP